MRYLFLITLLLSAITFSNAQDDGKLIVGVTKFKSESNPQAEKIFKFNNRESIRYFKEF
jgi:hypothetical protein